ncbi:MAG: winged helix-turn-helix domain-containing protein [Bradyrhizobium sp.]|uniref:winged helix-turn-helix domain-containing protein n=1 Tax=Bradyrhizobium sp. TaxID=376 RepID=UPI003D0A7F98
MDTVKQQLLERENEELRERVRQLEDVLGMSFDVPVEWGLTASEARLIGMLLRREIVSKENALLCLYQTRPDDMADPKIIDVFICKARKKLKPFGVEIRTVWGKGYLIDAETRARINASMKIAA